MTSSSRLSPDAPGSGRATRNLLAALILVAFSLMNSGCAQSPLARIKGCLVQEHGRRAWDYCATLLDRVRSNGNVEGRILHQLGTKMRRQQMRDIEGRLESARILLTRVLAMDAEEYELHRTVLAIELERRLGFQRPSASSAQEVYGGSAGALSKD